MTLDILFQPMRVLIGGHDTDDRLALADNQLAAVFVRLDGTHHDPQHKGWWHLEAGFGKCGVRVAPHVFKTPEGAGAWVESTLTRKDFKGAKTTSVTGLRINRIVVTAHANMRAC
ncbi:hypothetical protein [Microvirga sp. BSC39]|uniref:hypothetical protein n=1 Tax=Microvirga sp. BSC39 TaxID=1549810 RepID=UPI0004E89E77|nr:hypothetical protein [Microvirga sp. BSC39]KFG71097.1 hypothetical protein JH26_00025 [Microvirga sp. BSC39]